MKSVAKTRSRPVAVSVVGLVLGAFYLLVNLAVVSFDPAGLIQFGEEEPGRVAYAVEQFDREIPLAPKLGHDGRFFFIQASDPWFLDPAEHAASLDRPVYRAQRMWYPVVASAGGLLSAEGIALGMTLAQLGAFGLGTFATARLARRFGLSQWWGLTFALNPGVRFELEILGAGAIGMALLVAAIDAYLAGRMRWAIPLAMGAVLTREVLWASLAGVAVVTFNQRRRDSVALAVAPGIAAVAWAGFVRLRVGSLPTETTVQEIGTPFKGLLDAVTFWNQAPPDLSDVLLGGLSFVLALIVIATAARSRSPLIWGALGFAVLAPVLTRQVWINGFDISRALSPMFTFYLLFLGSRLAGSGEANQFVAVSS